MTARRLMIVDDHGLVRAGLRLLLAGASEFTLVAECADSAAALAELARSPVDLALVDVALGGGAAMNGLDLAAALSRAGVAVVMLSMHESAAYVRSAARAGARGYLLKDRPAEEILAALRQVAAGGTYYSAGLTDLLLHDAPGPALTEREREVLRLLAQGLSNKATAQRLSISVRTVETHRLSFRRKLGFETTTDLVKYAIERGWIAT